MKQRKGTWGGARPGSGPKPRPAAEVRRNAALVKLTDAERDLLTTAAAGEPLATWIRTVALRAAARRKGRR